MAARCSKCRDMESEGVHVVPGDLIKDVSQVKPSQVNDKLEPFLTPVNAMLNTPPEHNPGTLKLRKLCLHTETPHLLGDFDKKVDDKLMKMIPDDTMFSDNFNRYFLDSKHVIFEIVPQAEKHSTLDFLTKMSFNKGLGDPTQAQIAKFLSHDSESTEYKAMTGHVKPQNFVHGQPLKTEWSNEAVVFQESTTLQAKPSKDKHRVRNDNNTNRIELQARWWWEEKDLPQFISAFSKLPSGGSIFLGVHENTDKGKQTGIFVPKGIILNRGEMDEMREKLIQKAKHELLLIRGGNKITPSNPDHFEIRFHQVQASSASAPDTEYVVEVAVKHFPGLCFYKRTGPRSYELSAQTNKPKEISHGDWYRRLRTSKEIRGRKQAANTSGGSVDRQQAGPGGSPAKKLKT